MAQTEPSGKNPKPRKRSARAAPGRRPIARGKRPAAPAKKAPAPEPEPTPPPVGRMERTRRLLYAAIRVWELKRRLRD